MFLSIFLICHLAIASIAAGHALLNKEDVRSAIGWIGLILLSPGLGAGLYYAFGINRVARRAVKRNEPTQEPPGPSQRRNSFPSDTLNQRMAILANVSRELTGQTLLSGNRVELLQNGDAAYPAMIAEIEAAERSVCLATYIFRSDQVGVQFADALVSAFQRGVQVRVLVDAVGSGFFVSQVVRRLKANGLNVARFIFDRHPRSMAFINLRNHKKLLLVDGERGYVGGLNLGAENTFRFVGARRVEDIHFSLAGPIATQLMRDFARDWEFASGESLEDKIWWPHVKARGNSVCRVLTSGPDEDVGKIETLFAVALGIARRNVKIVTPYFLPDDRLCEALRLAALRGVKVDVTLPEKSDHLIVDWAMRGHLSFLKDYGLNYHLSKASFDHAKLLTVDGEWCAFGSPNWDVRSLRLNFELLIECYTKEVVGMIDKLVDQKMENSRPLMMDEISDQKLAVKLRNATARLFLPYL